MWKKTRLKPIKNSRNSMPSQDEIYKNLKDNVTKIKEDLGQSSDLIVRFINHSDNPYALAQIHIDGITNAQKINEHILEPLLQNTSNLASETLRTNLARSISVSSIKEKNTFTDILSSIVSGSTAIIIVIYPLGVIILICSLIIAPNYINHIKEGLGITPLHVPMQIVLPILLLMIAWIKRKMKASSIG